MVKTLIMLVGNADSPFVINEMPYISSAFDVIHIFAYNTKGNSQVKCKLPKNVIVHHVNVCKGWQRIVKYIPRGLNNAVPDLKIHTFNPRRLLASLYARGRSEAVYRFMLQTLDAEKIECSNGVIYSYWFTDQAIVAWRLAEELNSRGGHFKSYSRAHGYDLYWERNCAGFLPFQDVSLKHLDLVCPCSECGAKYLRDKYKGFAHKIEVARLGTRDYGLAPVPDSQKVFATCCIFQPLKRMPLFAEAFCSLWEKDKELRWYCIGDGPDFEKTKEIVAFHKAEAAVSFLGSVNNSELMEFYKRTPISYVVNVSTTEGVPVTVMEALSFGIPVLATDVGGTGELVSGQCGKLMNADIGVAGLEHELQEAIALDDAQYAKKRQCARRTWEALASAEKNYREWGCVLSR